MGFGVEIGMILRFPDGIDDLLDHGGCPRALALAVAQPGESVVESGHAGYPPLEGGPRPS